MNHLGEWLKKTSDHLVQQWQGHVFPAAVLFGGILAAVFLSILLIGAATVAVIIAAEGTSNETLSAGLSIGIAVVSTLIFLALMLAVQPLYLGYVRYSLLLLRGQQPQRSDLLWGVRHAGSVLFLLFIQFAVGITAALFCYFPALLVGAAFFFAIPAMADREVGAIESLRISWALVKPRFLEVLIYTFLLVLILTMLGYVPLLGPILSLVGFTTAMLVAYEDLVREDSFYETWRG